MSTDVSEVRSASIIIALMMEAARISETSVDIQLRTRQYIPEDSELQTYMCISEPGSSVSIVSGYGLDDRAIDVRTPAGAKRFFL
jgi:hypothetical protein